MRVASWNINGIRARQPNLLNWLTERQPDVVGLQELRTGDPAPLRRLEHVGYHVACTTHVALVSLEPLEDISHPTGDGRTVAATVNGVRFVSLYAPNGFKAGTDRHRAKVGWLEALGDVLAAEAVSGIPVVVVGDFNVALDDADVWEPARYRKRNLFTDAERGALRSVLSEAGLVDTFRRRHEGTGLFTWFNYAHRSFERGRGWRLDYILTDPETARRVDHAVIDVEERARPGTSDHAPLWVDLN